MRNGGKFNWIAIHQTFCEMSGTEKRTLSHLKNQYYNRKDRKDQPSVIHENRYWTQEECQSLLNEILAGKSHWKHHPQFLKVVNEKQLKKKIEQFPRWRCVRNYLVSRTPKYETTMRSCICETKFGKRIRRKTKYRKQIDRNAAERTHIYE